MHYLYSQVVDILRTVAREEILPYYGKLAPGDISEKSPGELVTIVDTASEAVLCDQLMRLLPQARTIGEESCARDDALLETVESGLVWIIDPIDGTSNFSAGEGPFGVIIALAEEGVTQAGWLYDPVTDVVSHAVKDGGAFRDEQRVRCSPPIDRRPIAACATQFLNGSHANNLCRAVAAQFDLVPIPRCAAEHYPRLVRGQNDLAIFQRTLPWDHAAGALFLEEAGGVVSCWDRSPYRLGSSSPGIVAATSTELWNIGVLATDAAGLNVNRLALHLPRE